VEFPALGKVMKAMRKYAPGKLAYINLYPDYASPSSQLGTASYDQYLESFVQMVKPQMISYDNYMVEFSNDLRDPTKAISYYRNLLAVRGVAVKNHLPCMNVVTSNQIRPQTTIPSPANLAFQAYTTLAAGCRGIGWYNYYPYPGSTYRYRPIDEDGRKTLTWAYLAEINRQVTTLAPIMSQLTSTGVFFSTPPPAEGLPVLPGGLIEAVTSLTPVMVGEFRRDDGARYVMLVNLSLERSARVRLKATQGYAAMQVVSAMDGTRTAFDAKEGLWLVAGQGVLLELGQVASSKGVGP
jgi:hypothetical protein